MGPTRMAKAGLYAVVVVASSAVLAVPAWGAAPPTVTRISPAYDSSAGGANINITGTNFEQVTEVRFGATAAKSVYVGSSTSLAVTAPPEVGTVAVTVTTTAGTSEVTAADYFTYTQTPEYGTCSKLDFTAGDGEYRNHNCDSVSELSAKYTWFPAFGFVNPLQKTRFTTAGSELKLETAARTVITCKAESGAGEYTGPQTVAESLTLTGCESGAIGSCDSEGANEGEVQTDSLDGLLGFAVKGKIGQELSGADGETFATFSCGGVPVTVRGGVIGEVKKTNKMTTAASWKAKEKKGGVQALAGFLSGPAVSLEVKIGAGAYERAGLGGGFTQTSEEEIEIST